jgi:hypothetical protein
MAVVVAAVSILAGCFPNASSTGTTHTLTEYTGNYEFRTDNEVVEDKLFNIPADTGVYVAADNVTFRHCKFVMQGASPEAVTTFTMVLVQGVGTRFEDVELDGRGVVERAIEADNDTLDAGVTVLRANIHDTGNGIESQGPLDVRESFIHAIYEPAGTDWHADGIQTPKGTDDVQVVHNTIVVDDPATSAVNIMGWDLDDPAARVNIENNLVGGGAYTLYVGPGGPGADAYIVKDNHFTNATYPRDPGPQTYGFYGPYTSDFGFDNVVFSGNVDEQTGQPVNP